MNFSNKAGKFTSMWRLYYQTTNDQRRNQKRNQKTPRDK